MNKEFQVLVWEKYEVKSEEKLGQPKIEEDFDTQEQAFNFYYSVKKFLCKMVMKYESNEPDADGDVLEEDWNNKHWESNEDFETRWGIK